MYKVLKTCKFAFEPREKQLSLTKDERIDLPEKKAEILLRYNYIEKNAEEANVEEANAEEANAEEANVEEANAEEANAEEANAEEANAETKVLTQGENKKIKLTYKKRNKS